MHGAPPLDFPKGELAELMGSHHYDAPGDHDHSDHNHSTVESKPRDAARDQQLRRQRLARLAAKMRSWPRTAENDPFYAGSQELADHLAAVSGCDVVVGFNEFCDPTVPAALDQAIAHGAEKIVVITPMMTKGGEHSELDISSAVRSAQKRHPTVQLVYAWPFEVEVVAQFLASQVQRFAGS
jgi:CbiX